MKRAAGHNLTRFYVMLEVAIQSLLERIEITADIQENKQTLIL